MARSQGRHDDRKIAIGVGALVFLPGLALLVFVGGAATIAGVLTIAHTRIARFASTVVGLGLCSWIVVQLAWLRIVHPVMQPFVFVSGVVIVLLARRLPVPDDGSHLGGVRSRAERSDRAARVATVEMRETQRAAADVARAP